MGGQSMRCGLRCMCAVCACVCAQVHAIGLLSLHTARHRPSGIVAPRDLAPLFLAARAGEVPAPDQLFRAARTTGHCGWAGPSCPTVPVHLTRRPGALQSAALAGLRDRWNRTADKGQPAHRTRKRRFSGALSQLSSS